VSKKSSPVPTLKALALDHLAAIAATLRKADPSLSREASIVQAAQTPEGRSTYAIYRMDVAQQPWPDAIHTVLEMSRPAIKTAAPRASRKAAPQVGPAGALYAKIVEQAVAAAPAGRSQPGAVADFLLTSAGQVLWHQYNAALQVEEE
jgi:hypothetical protein